jgi:hypothetical protein
LTRLVEAIAGYMAKRVGSPSSPQVSGGGTRRKAAKCLGISLVWARAINAGDLLTLISLAPPRTPTDHQAPGLDALIEATQAATTEADAKKISAIHAGSTMITLRCPSPRKAFPSL